MTGKWLRVVGTALVAALAALPVPAEEPEPPVQEETITVIGSRLPPEPADEDVEIPSPPEPLSLASAVSLHPSVVLYDQVGNGLEPEIDLRGWSEGTATAVLLDGVRWNEPDDNRFDPETIPLDDLEAIEVRPGASSTFLGSGAAGGALLLRLRDADGDEADFRTQIASHGTHRERGEGSVLLGRGFLRGSWTRLATDGFRDNGGGSIESGLVRGGGPAGKARWTGTALRTTSELGEPGALKLDEWREDPGQSPYNEEDESASTTDLLSVRGEMPLAGSGTLRALAAWRDRDMRVLTTGRSGAGFRTETGIETGSLVAEYRKDWTGRHRGGLSAGIEGARGRVRAEGEFTDSKGENPQWASTMNTERRTRAAWANAGLDLTPRWGIEGGLRFDREEIDAGGETLDFATGEPAPVGGLRTFDAWSPRLAGRWKPRDSDLWTLAVSQATLLPTPTDLFAYPTYGSNPDLRATRIREISLAWSHDPGEGKPRVYASAWRSVARDEVYFVTTALGTGENVNLPETRRQGIEAGLEVPLPGRGERVPRLLLALGWTRATFESPFRLFDGREVEPGDRIPLVPSWKGALEIEAPLPHGLVLSGVLRVTGPRHLQNDEPNTWGPLGSHALSDASLEWTGRRLAAFLAVENLFDRQVAPRGIAQVPDENWELEDFFTPSPGRIVRLGFGLRLGEGH